MFRRKTDAHRSRIAFSRFKNGQIESRTWGDVQNDVARLTAALAKLGLKAGDHVAILGDTCEEWAIADWALMMCGAVSVPIYPSLLGPECVFILLNSESRFVFVQDLAQLEKLQADRKAYKQLDAVILWSGESDEPNVHSMSKLLSQEKCTLKDVPTVKLPDPALLTIIYTSGTTGLPKGVMLSHANILYTLIELAKKVVVNTDDVQLIFLPFSHVLGRFLSYVCIYTGSTLAFAQSREKISEDMLTFRPTYFGAVPRVYEKVYEKVQAGVQKSPRAKRELALWAFRVGREALNLRQDGKPVPLALQGQLAVADKLVLSKIRARMGGRIRFSISGGAPISREVMTFFHAVGIIILEGYGLTETSGGVTANGIADFRIGSVGKALPGTELRISEEGEIHVRGPQVMLGYFQNPERTQKVLDADGWLNTGDVGVLDKNGFLRITDRKRDIIVTSGGKNISPTNLEAHLNQFTEISQSMVIGEKKNYLTAIVTIKTGVLIDHFKGKIPSHLNEKESLRALIQKQLDRLNDTLPSFETIKKFAIVDSEFSDATGELTPTMKLKRKVIANKYRVLIDSMYEHKLDFLPANLEQAYKEFFEHIKADRVPAAVQVYDACRGKIAGKICENLGAFTGHMSVALVAVLETTRDIETVAEVYLYSEDWEKAGDVYCQILEYQKAIDCFKKADLHLKTAMAYDKLEQTESALHFYTKANSPKDEARCLQKLRRHFDAAQIFKRIGNTNLEFRALSLLGPNAIEFLPATERIFDIFVAGGRLDAAITYLKDLTTRCDSVRIKEQILLRLAGAYRLSGDKAACDLTLAELAQSTGAVSAESMRFVDDFAMRAQHSDIKIDWSAEPDMLGKLRDLPIFRGLYAKELEAIVEMSRLIKVDAKDRIIEQGGAGRGIYILLEGSIQVKRLHKYGEVIVATLLDGSYVGEMSLLTDNPSTATVQAVVDSRFLFFPKEEFRSFLASNPNASLRIYHMFAVALTYRLENTYKEFIMTQPN